MVLAYSVFLEYLTSKINGYSDYTKYSKNYENDGNPKKYAAKTSVKFSLMFSLQTHGVS